MAFLSDFRAPDASANEDTKAGWHREMVQMGDSWTKTQRAYVSIGQSRELILDDPREDMPEGMSKVKVPWAKRNIRELVSTISNLRPTASNKTDNVDYYEHANIFNKIDRWWWYTTQADRAFRRGFQTAAVDGTAYVMHRWDAKGGRGGHGEIVTDIFDALSVYLIQPPEDHDLQRCYAVIFKKRVPLYLVHQQYPLRAHQIKADRGPLGYTSKGTEYVQSFLSSPLKALAGPDPNDSTRDDVWPSVDIYETYILDQSINLTGREVEMGEPGTSWSYKVPAYGSQIPTGTNGWDGVPLYRKATIDDAKLYPFRRCMVATSQLILEDGTSKSWHGMVPAARICFDDWPTEALGFPLTRDVRTIEDDNNQIMRAMSDQVKVSLDPAMQYDENLMSERLAERINPRQPGQRVKGNLSMGDMMKPLLPAGYQKIEQFVFQYLGSMEDKESRIMGVADLVALAKAKQVPSPDTIEKLMQMAGPLADDMIRGVETSLSILGDIRRCLNFQFRPLRRRLEILGDGGASEKDFDWDPGTMVPSHLPGEDPGTEEQPKPSLFTYTQRAREVLNNFYYYVVPQSMARRSQITKALMLLQAEKSGMPLDPWTKAEMFEVDNFGAPPKDPETGVQADSIKDRWILWTEFVAKMQQSIGAQGGQGKTGRPSSNKKAPTVKSKNGGTRSTISTS